jgi:cytochrome c5
VTTTYRALALTFVAACSAAQSTDSSGPASSAGAHQLVLDDSMQKACAVTEQTCSRCHDLGKVHVTRLDSALEWRQLVLRMRRQAGSGITDAEVHAAETCLVYQDLGRRGLDDLAALGAIQ